MKTLRIPLTAILLSLLVLSTTAQDITPLISSRTLAVAQVDLQRLDLAAAERLLLETLPAAEPDAARREKVRQEIVTHLMQARGWQNRLREAGARQVYGLLSLEGAMSGSGYGFVGVEEGKAQAVADLLATLLPRGQDGGLAVETFGGGVLFGPPNLIQTAKETKAEARPEMLEALRASDAPVRLILAPPTDLIRGLAALLPALPNRFGGGTAEPMVRGLQWASLSADLADQNQTFRLIIAARDATAAQAIGRLLGMLSDDLAARADIPAAKDVLAKLKAAPDQANRFVITLERAPALTLFGEVLAQSRAKATQAVSMSHIRQILVACHMYANDREGQWPDNLQTLVGTRYVARPEVIRNPRSPGGEGSYVYVKPQEPMSRLPNPGAVVIVHEALEGTGGKVAVGFADGHVELLPAEDVRKRIAQ